MKIVISIFSLYCVFKIEAAGVRQRNRRSDLQATLFALLDGGGGLSEFVMLKELLLLGVEQEFYTVCGCSADTNFILRNPPLLWRQSGR